MSIDRNIEPIFFQALNGNCRRNDHHLFFGTPHTITARKPAANYNAALQVKQYQKCSINGLTDCVAGDHKVQKSTITPDHEILGDYLKIQKNIKIV